MDAKKIVLLMFIITFFFKNKLYCQENIKNLSIDSVLSIRNKTCCKIITNRKNKRSIIADTLILSSFITEFKKNKLDEQDILNLIIEKKMVIYKKIEIENSKSYYFEIIKIANKKNKKLTPSYIFKIIIWKEKNLVILRIEDKKPLNCKYCNDSSIDFFDFDIFRNYFKDIELLNWEYDLWNLVKIKHSLNDATHN